MNNDFDKIFQQNGEGGEVQSMEPGDEEDSQTEEKIKELENKILDGGQGLEEAVENNSYL